jgi:uncharacterized protein (DUF2236 family)
VFGPESATWRVNRELVLLLAGGRALLLQVAHPLVAAGVAEHSDYRRDPWGRLLRTLRLTTAVAFADPDGSERAAARIWATHATVTGTTPDGRPYDARDPALLLWVWATLLDSSLLVHQSWVGPLAPDELARYHREQARFAAAFGVPEGLAPATPQAFAAYRRRMLTEELRVTDAARDVARHTLRPPVPAPLRPAFAAYAQLTAGLLPPALRAGYGLDWGPRRERALAACAAVSRRALPLVPAGLRQFPEARRAASRAGPRARRRSG